LRVRGGWRVPPASRLRGHIAFGVGYCRLRLQAVEESGGTLGVREPSTSVESRVRGRAEAAENICYLEP
jgi:hypothetical protein